MVEPAVATPPDPLLRVGRANGLLRLSTINPIDATLPKAGNRFDVPGGGVLYAATTAEACYAETLARFRPTPRMRELLKYEEPGFMVAEIGHLALSFLNEHRARVPSVSLWECAAVAMAKHRTLVALVDDRAATKRAGIRRSCPSHGQPPTTAGP